MEEESKLPDASNKKSFKQALTATRNNEKAFDNDLSTDDEFLSDEENIEVEADSDEEQANGFEIRIPKIKIPPRMLASIRLSPSEPLLDFPNRFSMNIMLWNCRGAGNKIFHRNFKEIIRTHRPDVVALFETKVLFSSMGLFFNNLGYTASTVVDPVGRVGGIWLIWNPTQVSVNAFVTNQ
ncbi:hypothetical protein LOK49_LG07G02097 [Camellia lanceoleosa]|uniref:Uncharacterized protein n=1 Tax=Camellia lanceoleosa TaxID=1840588 RepID=A0ACC0GZY4_9ERIC|nr:hypothetical protein LOK49_LG07G02097 [Camellia lanceoleosa]